MTPRTIPIPYDEIEQVLIRHDQWQTSIASGGGKLEEYEFWKYASSIIPDLATGHWSLDMSVPLHPCFVSCGRNQK